MTESKHPLVLALFDSPATAIAAAQALRAMGVAHGRVSIVARSHEEEGAIASASGASPGAELEDAVAASRLGELTAHFLSAIALVMPGIGPIVADGPLAAGLAEAAGHVAGGISRTLQHAGLGRADAELWQEQIAQGAVLVGAHCAEGTVKSATEILAEQHPVGLQQVDWSD